MFGSFIYLTLLSLVIFPYLDFFIFIYISLFISLRGCHVVWKLVSSSS